MSRRDGRVISILGDPDDPGPQDPEDDDPEDDDRPTCLVRPGRPEPFDATLEALTTIPGIYSRGGELVEVASVDDRPRSIAIDEADLTGKLTRALRYQSRKKLKEGWQTYDINPPTLAVRAAHRRGHWAGVNPLKAMVSAPPVHPDGSFQTDEGYDASTGAYYTPGALTGEVVPSGAIDQLQCCEARAELLNLVGDFHWAQEPLDADVWLAALLSPLVRVWTGLAPMVVFTGTIAGAGKGLLTRLIGIITEGRPISNTTWTDEQDEARKSLLSIALSGFPVVLFDNVRTGAVLGGAVLDMALTSSSVSGRLLKHSKFVETDLEVCFYATGNNISVTTETARRTLMCHLQPKCEHPERRTDFSVKGDLDAEVAKRREHYLRCALTILGGYLQAGRPCKPLPLGGFAGWAEVVAGAILWAGGVDVINALASRLVATDTDAEVQRRLLDAWRKAFPGGENAAGAVDYIGEFDNRDSEIAKVLREFCPGRGEALVGKPRSLATKLRGIEKRIREVDSVKLWLVRQSPEGAMSWIVKKVDKNG